MDSLWNIIGSGQDSPSSEISGLDATNAQEVLDAIAREVWEKDGNVGEPPSPTPDDLRQWMPTWDVAESWHFLNLRSDIHHERDHEPDGWQAKVCYRVGRLILQHAVDVPIQTRQVEVRKSFKFPNTDFEFEQDVIETEVLNSEDIKPRAVAGTTVIAVLSGWNDEAHWYNNDGGIPSIKEQYGISSLEDGVKAIYQLWDEVNQRHPDEFLFPLETMMQAWRLDQTHRNIKTASVDHVRDLTSCPYVVSEVNRRKWEPIGSVDAIEVDGEPIITQMSKLPGPFSIDYPGRNKRPKVYKPKGTTGDLMPMPPQRNHADIPIPLVAYQEFGDNLRKSIASDVAQIMTLAYAANEPLILSIKEGARLLARKQDGQLGRQIKPADEKRFNIAFACVHGMAGWITDDRGVHQFYPLTACDRFSDDRVSIAAASWARDRTKGRWTLTAGFGVAGQNRLKGNAHNNNVWRVITGVEYWLARENFVKSGTYKKISQALIPATGTTGPGNWYTFTWKKLMMIAGDVWDWNDKTANKRAHKRFEKIKDALIQHGYQIKNLNRPAEAGDTVEFLFKGKDGKVMVRATERFVEGARKAKRKDWQTYSMGDFLGF